MAVWLKSVQDWFDRLQRGEVDVFVLGGNGISTELTDLSVAADNNKTCRSGVVWRHQVAITTMLALVVFLLFLTVIVGGQKTIICPVDERWAEVCLCSNGTEEGEALMICKSCSHAWKRRDYSWLSRSPTFHSDPTDSIWTLQFDDVCFFHVPPRAFQQIAVEEIRFGNIKIDNFTLDRGAFEGSRVRRLYFSSEGQVEIFGLYPVSANITHLLLHNINLGVIPTGGFDGLHDCTIRLQSCKAREIQSHSFVNLVNCSLTVEEGPLGAIVDPYAFANSRFATFSYPSLERSLCTESWFRNVSVHRFNISGYRGRSWPYCIEDLGLTGGPNGERSEFLMENSWLTAIKRVDTVTSRANSLFRRMSVESPVNISFRFSLELTEIDADTFDGVAVLNQLDLSETGLTRLPDFPQHSHVTLVTLVAPNRLACDCESLWMYRWIADKLTPLAHMYQFCKEPNQDFISLIHHLCTLPSFCPVTDELKAVRQEGICLQGYWAPNFTDSFSHEIPSPTDEISLEIIETDDERTKGSEPEIPDKSSAYRSSVPRIFPLLLLLGRLIP